MDQAERLERIEDGRNAVLASGFLMQPIREVRESIIQRLVNLYRSGAASHDNLVGGIAEIRALDDLVHYMQNAVQKGNVAEEQEYK